MSRLLSTWLAHPWLFRLAAVGIALVTAFVTFLFNEKLFNTLQEQSSDFVWRVSARAEIEHRVVFIDIDDSSLQATGPWPWARETMAELTNKLDAAGVGLKLFDVVFPDAREGDLQLAAALQAAESSPSVLAQVFALRNESRLRLGTLAGALPGIGCQAPAVPAQGFVANSSNLSKQLAGHITPTIDADGAVRQMAALVCMEEKVFPALALAGMVSMGESNGWQIRSGQDWKDPAWKIEFDALPKFIGVSDSGQVRIPFSVRREALTRVSASDVMAGRLPDDLLRGAWVIIGSSAFGLADVVPVALGGAVSGAEIHLQLLLGMLDGHVPYSPNGAAVMQLLYLLATLSVLFALASSGKSSAPRRVLWIPGWVAVAALGAYGLHAWILLFAGWYVGWIGVAWALVFAGLGLALCEQARILTEKKRIFQNFASYVSAPVAQKIAFKELSGEIQARNCDVTILAVDIKNFARYCEACTPEEAAGVLHQFFTTACAIVEANGGMVEEMVGDSLVAVFNGEHPCENHNAAALSSARDIWRKCSSELPNAQALGLESLAIGVGLESGKAMVGSFGPKERRVHTVLGQTVSVALRLRAMTPDLAYPVLLGQELAQKMGVLPHTEHMELKSLGSFLLPGLMSPSTIYTLRNLLQPGDVAEQRTLLYLSQQQDSVA